MKQFLVISIRWGVLGAIALIFLVLPDLVQKNMVHPSWVARVFVTFFLGNSFIGATKIFNNPSVVKKELSKYRDSDKDTLILSYILGHLFYIVSTIIIFSYGLASFYPFIGWWKYSLTVFYGISISVMHCNICKMQIRQIRDNEKME